MVTGKSVPLGSPTLGQLARENGAQWTKKKEKLNRSFQRSLYVLVELHNKGKNEEERQEAQEVAFFLTSIFPSLLERDPTKRPTPAEIVKNRLLEKMASVSAEEFDRLKHKVLT